MTVQVPAKKELRIKRHPRPAVLCEDGIRLGRQRGHLVQPTVEDMKVEKAQHLNPPATDFEKDDH